MHWSRRLISLCLATWGGLAAVLAETSKESILPTTINHPGTLVSPKSLTVALPGQPEPVAKSNIVRPNPGTFPSIIENKTIVGYYGNPYSKYMGILGETSIAEAIRGVKETAAQYDAVNGDDGVISAFHLIIATVQPDASLIYLPEEKILEYVQAAQANGLIVILDNQLGKNDVRSCVRRMLPWLNYPNVHLAIDPEWATTEPGKEIGSIDAADVNAAMDMIQTYLVQNNIKQRKLFVVHQFQWRMILNRDKIRNDFDRIDLIHNADGFGGRDLKLDTYRFIAATTTIPLKGFKLFLPKTWKADGFDIPLWKPQEVMDLQPRPVFINYQ